MGKYILLVQSNPTDGKEAEYNAWYDDVHLGEVLEVNGFTAAQRFKVEGEPATGAPAHAYLAIYEIEAEKGQDALDALNQAVGGGMNMSDAIDLANVSAVLYSPRRRAHELGAPRGPHDPRSPRGDPHEHASRSWPPLRSRSSWGDSASACLAPTRACDEAPAPPPHAPVETAYGDHPRERIAYLAPRDGVAPRSPVLYFHGGGWMIGSKDTYTPFLGFLAEAGHPVFNIGYPLAPEHPHPEILRSVFRALDWIAAKHPETTGYHTMGDSAGGNLAAMLGLLAHNPEHVTDVDASRTQGLPLACRSIVSIYGVLDRLTWIEDGFPGGSTMLEHYGGKGAFEPDVGPETRDHTDGPRPERRTADLAHRRNGGSAPPILPHARGAPRLDVGQGAPARVRRGAARLLQLRDLRFCCADERGHPGVPRGRGPCPRLISPSFPHTPAWTVRRRSQRR